MLLTKISCGAWASAPGSGLPRAAYSPYSSYSPREFRAEYGGVWASARVSGRSDRPAPVSDEHQWHHASIDGRHPPAARPCLAYLSGRARGKYEAGHHIERGNSLGSMTTRPRFVDLPSASSENRARTEIHAPTHFVGAAAPGDMTVCLAVCPGHCPRPARVWSPLPGLHPAAMASFARPAGRPGIVGGRGRPARAASDEETPAGPSGPGGIRPRPTILRRAFHPRERKTRSSAGRRIPRRYQDPI
jgi:hypothetical protein